MNFPRALQPEPNKTAETTLSKLPVAFSLIKKEQLSLVYSTWMESFRESKFARSIRKNVYFSYLRLKIDQLLERPGTRIVTAHLDEDPDCIFSWLCLEMSPALKMAILHYIFTKYKYRKLTIGKQLLDSVRMNRYLDGSLLYYTHRNNADPYKFTISWLEEKNGFTYNPYLF